MLEAVVGAVDDLVDREWRGGPVGMVYRVVVTDDRAVIALSHEGTVKQGQPTPQVAIVGTAD